MLNCVERVSSFAFNLSLRRYNVGGAQRVVGAGVWERGEQQRWHQGHRVKR